MTSTDNAAGIYLPPGATDEGATQAARFSSSADDDDKDLLNIEDDLEQLLSDVIEKPDKPTQKQSPSSKPSPTKKPELPIKPAPAPRPTQAARTTTAAPGKTPPKPAPRKNKPTALKSNLQQEKTKEDAENIAVMDDSDILKYIQENAPEEEATLDLF